VGNVTLDVEDENTPAMRLYQHFGFRHSADFWEGELSLRK
jgi:ribosomal protein S18 acetylase RimI-like enzyme